MEANAHDSAHENSERGTGIKGLPARSDSHEALAGQLLQRKRRRRLDLRSVNGTLREHARVYRELAEKRIGVLEAETRSRVLRRHSEVLHAVEQAQRMESLAAQLEQLEQRREMVPAFGDYANTDTALVPSGEATP